MSWINTTRITAKMIKLKSSRYRAMLKFVAISVGINNFSVGISKLAVSFMEMCLPFPTTIFAVFVNLFPKPNRGILFHIFIIPQQDEQCQAF